MDYNAQNEGEATDDGGKQPTDELFSLWGDRLGGALMDACHILHTRRHNGMYEEKDLDETLEHIDHVASALRLYRNRTRCRILLLPTELLGKIFFTVCTLTPPEFNTGFRTGSIGWIRIAHVCHDWRELALSMPLLWAQCAFTLPSGHEARLARSQSVPLTIHFDLIDARIPFAVIEASASQVARAQEISMADTSYGDFLWRSWRDAFSAKNLPTLRTLAISRRIPVRPETFDVAQCTAPNLESVRFENVFVPFISYSLRVLDMNFGNITRDDSLPSAQDFLSFLQSASSTLEKLFLENCFPDVSLYHQETPRVISLPRLEELRLENSTRRCVALKKSLDTPPSIDLFFKLDPIFPPYNGDPPLPPSEVFSTVVHALEPYIYGTTPSRPVVGLAHTEYVGNYTLQTCLCTRNPGAKQAWTGPFGDGFDLKTNVQIFQWSPGPDGPNLLSTFASLTAASSFSHIEILEFTLAFQDYPEQRWREVLAPLTSIHTLFIDDQAGQHPYDGLISALDRPGAHDATVEPSAVLFPSLRTLWFYHIDFDGSDAYTQARDAFAAMVTYRSEHVGLQQLNIDIITTVDDLDGVNPYIEKLRAFVAVSDFCLAGRSASLVSDVESILPDDEPDEEVESDDGDENIN
ncbi:hypothetical protein OF83DRAFT_1173669 [Amylostereum chailletii]|nr:hypothetical protein OF83DRAFT_1173669 [Amylostereum chailletii]